ncbi:MAG: segregation and condensation protein A [Anaerolineae bacterium]
MTAFEVTSEVFDGPLDLLLTLVRRRSLDITTVALAEVTGQYLAYLARLEAVDPGALAAFCEVAATLIVIKSRALLPREKDDLLGDEGADADELAARLEAYRRYKEVAGELGARERQGLRAFARVAPPPADVEAPLVPEGLGAEDVAAAFRAALAAMPRDEAIEPQEVQPYTVSIGERLVGIRDALQRRGRMTFAEVLTAGPRTREFVIVSFLAVLELLRRGAVQVVQDNLFDEMTLAVLSEAALAAAGAEGTFLDEP